MKKKKTKKTYGEIIVGALTPTPKKIAIISFLQATFKDNRHITVSELENDEGFSLSVENIPSSGRNPQSNIWLSKESLIGFQAAITLFLSCKGYGLSDLKQAIDANEISYSLSDNLTAFDKSKMPNSEQNDEPSVATEAK